MNNPEEKQPCIYCGDPNTALRVEPFIKELSDEALEVWICDDCYRKSAGDLE